MHSLLRIATALLGVFFVLQGLLWVSVPARAAAGLDMPLLDGLARSTQIGDLASFFLVAGTTMIVGARRGIARLLLVPAGMLAVAAAIRTLAWALHGADFAAQFIGIEVAAALLLTATSRIDASA